MNENDLKVFQVLTQACLDVSFSLESRTRSVYMKLAQMRSDWAIDCMNSLIDQSKQNHGKE